MPADPNAEPSCAACATVLRKKGATTCWSPDPAAAPPRPGNCPTAHHGDLVESAMMQCGPGGTDERLSRMAAEVEGLCYENRPGGAVHARWTRVEDTVALAKRMGWRRVGIATCIGLLDDMNVIVGLCVGHDMLFARHAEAPTTTLVAKDRVTGHNPAAALYGTPFYYKRLTRQQVSSPRGEPRGGG